MNIVIVGAGNVGLHIASILSKLNHNVIIIEKDEKRLEEAKQNLDIGVRLGSGTDWMLLDELSELPCDLLLALTDSDETNLALSSMAKYLNFPLTIARIRQPQFINCERLDFSRIFHVDYLIAPELLVAIDLFKLIAYPKNEKVYSFAHGAVQTRVLQITEACKKKGIPLSELNIPANVKIGLIKREDHLIFPHGNDVILPGDEITLIGEFEDIQKIHTFFNIKQKKIKNVVIAGGSEIGYNLAKILIKEGVQVKIIEKDFVRCEYLSQQLPEATVLHHDATDPLFLSQEKIMNADAFVCAVRNDAQNLLMGKLAKNLDTKKIFICLANPLYASLAEEVNLDGYVFLHKGFENRILAIIHSEKFTSKIFLYEEQAEILEIKVTNSSMTGIPIVDLAKYLPRDFLIAAIKNRGRVLIANGSRILSPGDTVIAITHPRHTKMLQDLF